MKKQEWVSHDVCGLPTAVEGASGMASMKIPRVVTVYKILDTTTGLFSRGGVRTTRSTYDKPGGPHRDSPALYAVGGTLMKSRWSRTGKTWNRRGDLTAHLRANHVTVLDPCYRIMAVSFLVSQR